MALQLHLDPVDEEDKQETNDIHIVGNIAIKTISQNEIYAKQKQFNSNNHSYASLTDDIKAIESHQLSDAQYYQTLEKTKYSNYAKLISNNNDRFYLTLTTQQVQTLYKASTEGVKCGGIPDKFQNQMQNLIEYIQKQLNLKTNDNSDKVNDEKMDTKIKNENYFVRLDCCSPKDTIYGFGPFNYDNIKFLVCSLCASERCHTMFKRYSSINSELFLWFVKWRQDINIENEFRCFVYNKKLTAISQYKWMSAVPKWSDQSNYKILIEMVPKIEMLVDKMCRSLKIGQFTLDVHVNFNKNEWDVEIIELNSFGVQMSCGSALFHWIDDFEQLYGFKDKIEIRIVK